MVQSKGSAPLRVGLVLALTVSAAGQARLALAEGNGNGDQNAQPAGGTSVVIHGGNFSTDNKVSIGADGVTTTADSSGGDTNTSTTGGDATADGSGGTASGGDIDTASSGNGGTSSADGSGGTFYSPTDADGNPIPAVDTGGNQGATINVGDTTGGAGTTSINIYGGDMSVKSDLSYSVSGGPANADASGGDSNTATLVGASLDVSGQIAAAGNGGNATASATGGVAPLGTILGGHNKGATINLGDVTAGAGNAGNIDIKIDGGTMDVTTISSLDVATGGTASALAPGGIMNVAALTGNGQSVFTGNGGTSTAAANGGITTIGTVNGPLYNYPIAGNNVGATINVMGVQGGSGSSGGRGGDATVDVYGGDLTTFADGVGGGAYAAGNIGAQVNTGMIVSGDGSWGGQGGDATLKIDAGSIDAFAAGPNGADAGDNRGANIMVGETRGGAGIGGEGGDATVKLEGSDIATAGTGLQIDAPAGSSETVNVPWGGPGASAGEGGKAVANANSGSASTGKIWAGDNVGTQIRVGDTTGGDGIGGRGGDATVDIAGTDISTSFLASVNVSGGSANSTALGGADNVAGVPLDDGGLFPLGSASAAAGSGGFAGSSANGGTITIGDVFVGNNNGGVIAVGNVTGGTGSDGGTGGNATFKLAGGSITAAVLLNLAAVGGDASASADGGSGNNAQVLGDGTLDLGAAAGAGGVALAGANGGTITIGDVHVGGNVGASAKVGNITGGDGSWGGVGGDATLAVEGSSILSVIELDLQANGGKADASADGGNNNVALFDARDATKLSGIDVLAGVGGVANAFANGGTITIGELFAGGNQGTVVKFGNITGGDGSWGATGESHVFNKFGGDVVTITKLAMASNGGDIAANADGGSGNVAVLTADGTTTIGVPSAGNGGTAVGTANGGPITVGNVTSGNNRGAAFIQPGNVGGNAHKPNAAPAKPGAGKPGSGGTPGKNAGAIKTISTPSGGGKGGKVAKLPATGDGPMVAGAASAGLGLLSALTSALGAIGIRRRRED